MTEADAFSTDADVVSFLLRNSLTDDRLFLQNHSSHKNRRYAPISLENAFDIIRSNSNEADDVVWTIIYQNRTGSIDSFLGLIDLLQKEHKNKSALVLNTYALSIFENSGDLHATEIELLLQWADASSISSIVQEIIETKYKTCWSPRFCRALCSFFWNLAKAMSPGKKAEVVREGIQYATDLQVNDPTSEWGYYWEVRMLWLISPNDAAKQLKNIVVFAQPPPFREHVRDSRMKLCCPRCCQLFIKNMLSLTQIEHVIIKGYQDAFQMTYLELSPKERIEIADLLCYFRDELERWNSYQELATNLLNKPIREVPAGISRENNFEYKERNKTKFDKESQDYG